jgi:hypothetical protein
VRANSFRTGSVAVAPRASASHRCRRVAMEDGRSRVSVRFAQLVAAAATLALNVAGCGGQSGAEGMGPDAPGILICKSDTECGGRNRCLCGCCVQLCSKQSDCSVDDGWVGCAAAGNTGAADMCSLDDSASRGTKVCHDQADLDSEEASP